MLKYSCIIFSKIDSYSSIRIIAQIARLEYGNEKEYYRVSNQNKIAFTLYQTQCSSLRIYIKSHECGLQQLK